MSKKRKKKKAGPRYGEKLLSSLNADRSMPDSQLAKLAEKAKQAMLTASELAGEDVVYCCGLIRKKSSITYQCGCSKSLRHQIINGLTNEI